MITTTSKMSDNQNIQSSDSLLSKLPLGNTLFSYFKDLLDDDREMTVIESSKDNGSLIYELKMTLQDKGNPVAEFPAKIRVEPTKPEDFPQPQPDENGQVPPTTERNLINLYTQFPNPSNLDELTTIDESKNNIKGLINSKSKVEYATWDCFDAIIDKYGDMKEFMEKFGVRDLNEFDFSEELDSDDGNPPSPESQPTPQNNPPANSSKVLNVALKKITAGTEQKLEVQSIKASYDASEALSDLNTLQSDPTIFDDKPDDETFYIKVSPTSDSLEIEDAEDSSIDNWIHDCRQGALDYILNTAYMFYLDCSYLSQIVCGPNMDEMKSRLSSYIWRSDEIISTISNLIVEYNYTFQHPIDRIAYLKSINTNEYPVNECFYDEFFRIVCTDISNLIQVLELNVVNFDDDVKSVLLNWIRNWKHEEDYVLYRGNRLPV